MRAAAIQLNYFAPASADDWPALLRQLFSVALPAPRSDDDEVPVDRQADDSALVRRFQGGDREAFNLLFRRHVDCVFRRLTRLLGPVPEREDLVQEVFISVYRGLDRFRGDASFSTWLYRIVVHVAYSHLRRRRRTTVEIQAEVEADRSLDAGLSPEEAARQRQQLTEALALLQKIKPKKRIAFLLRVVEGLSLAEIGEIVEATPAAVGQRVRHADRELRKIVEQRRKKQLRELQILEAAG